MVESTILGTEPVGKLGHPVYNAQWVRTMRLNELKHMINLQARVRFSSYDELKITRPRMRQKFRADTGVSITVAGIPFI